jgi:hypothetical protein
MLGETYIARLRREIAERRARRAAAGSAPHDPRAKLKARIANWYRALPPEARASHYFMEDLANWLHVPPQQLGMALRDLGWRCDRVWLKGQPYRHYWIPPHTDLQPEADPPRPVT